MPETACAVLCHPKDAAQQALAVGAPHPAVVARSPDASFARRGRSLGHVAECRDFSVVGAAEARYVGQTEQGRIFAGIRQLARSILLE